MNRVFLAFAVFTISHYFFLRRWRRQRLDEAGQFLDMEAAEVGGDDDDDDDDDDGLFVDAEVQPNEPTLVSSFCAVNKVLNLKL